MSVHILSLRSRRQNRAWGGALRNPGYDQVLSHKPAAAGDSHWLNLYDDEMAHDKKLPPASAGLMRTYAIYLGFRLTLHPRLYSSPRLRGVRTPPNVSKDKNPYSSP